jgi:hypothetical protein
VDTRNKDGDRAGAILVKNFGAAAANRPHLKEDGYSVSVGANGQ